MNKFSSGFLLTCVTVASISCSKTSSQANEFVGNWQSVPLKEKLVMVIKPNEGGEGFIVKTTLKGQSEHQLIGVINGKALVVSAPFIGAMPITIENGTLHFNEGRGCKQCDLFEKIK